MRVDQPRLKNLVQDFSNENFFPSVATRLAIARLTLTASESVREFRSSNPEYPDEDCQRRWQTYLKAIHV